MPALIFVGISFFQKNNPVEGSYLRRSRTSFAVVFAELFARSVLILFSSGIILSMQHAVNVTVVPTRVNTDAFAFPHRRHQLAGAPALLGRAAAVACAHRASASLSIHMRSIGCRRRGSSGTACSGGARCNRIDPSRLFTVGDGRHSQPSRTPRRGLSSGRLRRRRRTARQASVRGIRG